MAKTLFIQSFLCFINIFIINCYNINDKNLDSKGYMMRNSMLNTRLEIASPSSISGLCIPVQAMKELGCIISKNNHSFEGLFQSVCERHQLCYACGFSLGITEQQCNKRALVAMYNACSKNKPLSSSTCIKQSVVTLSMLRHNHYRTYTNNLEYYTECRQQCVLNYIRSR